MNKLDVRRLTGPSVIWPKSGAVVDVSLSTDDNVDQIAAQWQENARRMLDAVGWNTEQVIAHPLKGGISLALSAPIDALYAAVEIADWAIEQVMTEQEDDEHRVGVAVERLQKVIADERNPALIELCRTAESHGLACLSDDDEVSVGLGRGSLTQNVDSIMTSIKWKHYFNIPVGLVTGTNGKTTTVRLSQHILRAAGLTVGISSTDWIGVNDEIIDRGDYSGPGGARAVLRHTDVDVAVLETARGGLLRRGLGVQHADAAVITNVAEDHLGDFGSQDLDELLNLKWIVMSALDQQSMAILNADDQRLVCKAAELTIPITWFSPFLENSIIQNAISNSQPVVTVREAQISRFDGKQWYALGAVAEIPITINGTASHNIANALAACALSHVLGADDKSIHTGLVTMQLGDNPGRCNFFQVNGSDVLLDFAHNPSAMQALFKIAAHHSAHRRILCFGQAGDRTDEQILELAAEAWAIGLDHVIISELDEYRRGREPGEVHALLRKGLIAAGARDDQITHYPLEAQSMQAAIQMAKPSDLIIMLALADSRNILQTLRALDETPSL